MIVFILEIITFLIDINLSNYIMILAIISILPITFYLISNYKKFLINTFLLGIIYDLLFSPFFGVNTLLFIIMGLVIIIINRKSSVINYLSIIISSVIIILFYETILYLVINITGYNIVPKIILFNRCYKVLIASVIYVSIIYLIFRKKLKNKNKRKLSY